MLSPLGHILAGSDMVQACSVFRRRLDFKIPANLSERAKPLHPISCRYVVSRYQNSFYLTWFAYLVSPFIAPKCGILARSSPWVEDRLVCWKYTQRLPRLFCSVYWNHWGIFAAEYHYEMWFVYFLQLSKALNWTGSRLPTILAAETDHYSFWCYFPKYKCLIGCKSHRGP